MSIEVIARADELAVVEAFLDRPSGGLRALIIEGEAGIGKSTLWFAGLAAAKTRSYRVLSSRPSEAERTLPNMVLGDLFGDVAPPVLASLPAPRRRAFESALLLGDLPDVPVDPRALGVAILTLLPLLGGGGPLLLAIDDDQWADPSSTTTLLFALRRLQNQPLALLLARRTGVLPPTPALDEAVDAGSVERLSVGPLSLDGIQSLLRGRLGLTVPKPALVRLHEASGGNALYVLELGRAQLEDPGRDVSRMVALSPSLERLVGDRFTSLDAETSAALLLVAAHGRSPKSLLRALGITAGTLDRTDAAGLTETQDDVVRFQHPVLASTVYRGASADARRDAHRRLAEAVEDPVHRGRHLALAANEPSADLAAALELAAGAARDRGTPIAAAELAEHAMRLTPPGAADDLHRRTLLAARAHSAAGEGSRARAIAVELVAGSEAGARRAEALALRADLEQPAAAMTLLEEALGEAAGVPELQTVIHSALAEVGFLSSTRGREWSEDHARTALRLADALSDDAARATALATLASLRVDLEMAEEAYELAVALADPKPRRKAAWAVGHILTWLGKADPARDWLERGIEYWSEHDERVRADMSWYLTLVELWSGRWDRAAAHAEQVLELAAQYGSEHPYNAFPPALVAVHVGDFALARSLSQRGLSLGEGQDLELYFGVLATCDLWSGDPSAALASFSRAEQASDAIDTDDPSMRYWRADHVEALLQLGRVDDAERLIDDWETAARRLGRDRVVAQSVRCRGLVAAARGDISTATDLLEEAVRAHEAAGDPFGRARALLALGVALRRTRQKRTARASIEAALTTFVELGAASWAAAARAELARIGGRTRIVGLSPSEASVAALVAEGRTNQEIASALFLGERTVASHLTHIYSKLGIRSRTELARHLLRDAPPEIGTNTPRI